MPVGYNHHLISIYENERNTMKRQVNLPGVGIVEGEDVEFNSILEQWNKYRLADGYVIRAKTVVSAITRLPHRGPDGLPQYVIKHQTIVEVDPLTH